MIIETPSEEQWDQLQSRLLKFGVFINLLGPFVIFIAAYVWQSRGVGSDLPVERETTFKLMLYILGLIALGEIAVGAFLKKAVFFNPQKIGPIASFAAFGDRCQGNVVILHALGAAPAIYGLVLVLFGGTIEHFIFFLVLSLLGYRILRPDKAQLQALWDQLQTEERV